MSARVFNILTKGRNDTESDTEDNDKIQFNFKPPQLAESHRQYGEYDDNDDDIMTTKNYHYS